MLRNRRNIVRTKVTAKPSTESVPPPTTPSRIPALLQAVFLSSNRGNEVLEPPPNRIANRVFSVGRKLRGPWGKKKKNPDSLGAVERNESSTSSNDDSIPTTISASSSSTSSPAKYYQDIVIFPHSTVPKTKALPVESLKVTPQSFVDAIMKSRGYSITKYDALKTAYHNAPTSYQKACYDAYIIRLVKEERNCAALQQLLVAGLSSNPCNAYGESLLHTICRLGNIPTTLNSDTPNAETSLSFHMLRILLNVGHVDVTNCVDDYGRTPLHDACWSIHPCWETITTLLTIDPTLLLLRDCRGSLPLSYIPQKYEQQWLEYLSQHKDQLFPVESSARSTLPSPLVHKSPNSRPVPDPFHALTVDLAKMVASGRITPEEVAILLQDDDGQDEDTEDGGSVYADDDEEEDDMSEVDDSSTLLSAEGNYFPTGANSPPKALGQDEEELSEVSSDEDDDASESDDSYAELEAMMRQFQHSKNLAEGRIGIARPQYGNEEPVVEEECSQMTPLSPAPLKTSSYYHVSELMDTENGNHELPMVSICVPSCGSDASVAATSLTMQPLAISDSTALKASLQENEVAQVGLLEFSV